MVWKEEVNSNFENILEFRNVSKAFPRSQHPAISDISLSVKKGGIFGIIGTTGAGKSTLLRFANLLESPDTGNVFFEGKDISFLSGKELREHRSKVGMVFQQSHLVLNRKVFDNIALPLKAAGWTKEQIQRRVQELLKLIGLEEKIHSYPNQLSGGQKQRVGIARAIANHPRLLLCDEPTSALDPETTRSILSLLKSIHKKFGITIVIVTHEMEVVREICDSVAVVEKGKLIELGSAYSLFADPSQEITKKLTGAVLDHSIPEETLARTTGRILKVVLKDEVATEPILAKVIRATNYVPNILHSKIEYISGKPIGVFYLETERDESSTETIRSAFARYGAQVEEVYR
ncbi:methionine ABC transporter ATP-binding protein [Leptospira langatensis]|uniref:Cell division ATP-binding protein FtsE n=1 Tax=Leptospira langatensis TaxID=2484983 RepID=A0A5F1ZMQ4_9LEPT|nr:methionine ABC transporter ATP-binding protein [Leptospira langatensis]TGK05118.1 methionine ABC transporter ATP-binding protein [Leptospira langatensis]TGL38254.1 methionine ABC transporter ATP-binding protein [Leptospira langatensis]